MSLTIGTAITLSTGNVARQFGTYSMQIDTPAVSGFASTTIKLKSLPKLSQNFDLQVEAQDLSELKINLSEIEFVAFDELGDGESLINLISGLNLSDAIRIKSVVTPTGGSARTDYFLANKSNCSYDWFSRTVTIKANSAFRYDNTITGYSISGLTIAGTTTPAGGDNGQPWILPRDLIQTFLDTQGDSPNTFIVGSIFDETKATFTTNDITWALASGDYDDGLLGESTAYAQAQETVVKLSVIEGALVGVAMGDAFYVRRNYDTETTVGGVNTYLSLSASDISSYSLKTNERSIRNYDTEFRIQVERENETQTATTNYLAGGLATQEISSFGAYDVNLDYQYLLSENPDMYIIEDVSGYGVSHTTDAEYTTLTTNAVFDVNARKSYAAALGITGVTGALANQMFSVQVEFFDVTSFRPFQFIKFGTDINPFLNNKKLRPSSFEYDLEKDMVSVEGYFIG